MEIGIELMGNIIGVLKKVVDEEVKYEQAFHQGNGFEVTAIRFVTGYHDKAYIWYEIVFVYLDLLDRQKYLEIISDLHERKFFKYYRGYDEFYGRLVYIVPNRLKGKFEPKLVVKKVALGPWSVRKFERTLYVVLNPKLPKEKVIASALAYLVNYFANRANRLEATLTNSTARRVNVWRRVRMIFNGKVPSLSRSLSLLYNSIYYRVEDLEEQGRISDLVAKTLKLLTNLFFTFAKAFDKYGAKIYAMVVTKHLYKIIKERVGFSNVPTFAKNVIAYWNMVNKWLLSTEVSKILRAQPVES